MSDSNKEPSSVIKSLMMAPVKEPKCLITKVFCKRTINTFNVCIALYYKSAGV